MLVNENVIGRRRPHGQQHNSIAAVVVNKTFNIVCLLYPTVKLQFSLCSIKHHAMVAFGGLEV
jgi:hypothetical protein